MNLILLVSEGSSQASRWLIRNSKIPHDAAGPRRASYMGVGERSLRALLNMISDKL